jgi:hypothetical protein
VNPTVQRSYVERFLEACGFSGELTDVAKIEVTAQGVKIVQLRRDENGRLMIVDDVVATVVTVVRVQW